MNSVKRLGIILAHGPASAEARIALELSLAAREAGVGVHLFAMDDGVRIGDAPFYRELADAVDALVLCGTNCERRAVVAPEGARVGSQHDHATIVRSCDRVVALT